MEDALESTIEWIRRNWKTGLGLAISGVSLYFALRNLHLADVWSAFRQAVYVWIVPAVALYLLALMARTARWQALLSAERHVPFLELLPTMAMGRGANNIYPFRTGELVRVFLLRRRNGVPASAGLASILVERVFDGLTMVLFLILAALIGGIPPYLRYIVWAALIVFGGALVGVYSVVLWPEPLLRIAEWFIDRVVPQRFRVQLRRVAEGFVYGFASIKSVLTLTRVLFFSLSVWTAETISYRLMMNCFGFNVTLHQLLLMSGAANLGTALPSGPGNVGTFDLPAIEVLSRVGILRATAASYQALLHAVLWSTETFYGLWFMWRAGLGKGELDRALAESASGAGE